MTMPDASTLEGLAARLTAMRDFLNGERALDGTWFGENPAPFLRRAVFWWRRPMTRDLTAAIDARASIAREGGSDE